MVIDPLSQRSTTDITATVQHMKNDGNQFAVATVVRTVSVTAAKPGAKAIINADGDIVDGWIGGGCARHAVIKAAIKSIADGEPRLVSLQPEELLAEQGLTAGAESNGVLTASNMCPSRGSMDIFIEPILSDPELLIFGASPVAKMLATLARPFAFNLSVASNDAATWGDTGVDVQSYDALTTNHEHRYIVVATQGSGDADALQKALELQSRHIGFVGSPRKTRHLKDKLCALNLSPQKIASIKGPAGLNIGGVTPQEIALSILAEIIALHRAQPSRSTEATQAAGA
ncbi:MAG: XdhC/CoxI family protein [Pseudomonadota bacterium]